jgi:hypothetical protein
MDWIAFWKRYPSFRRQVGACLYEMRFFFGQERLPSAVVGNAEMPVSLVAIHPVLVLLTHIFVFTWFITLIPLPSQLHFPLTFRSLIHSKSGCLPITPLFHSIHILDLFPITPTLDATNRPSITLPAPQHAGQRDKVQLDLDIRSIASSPAEWQGKICST